MDVKLKVLTGKHAGTLIPLAGPQFLIGRAEDCQLRAGSDLISRHHCALLIRDSYIGIKDFGSRNGTLVNGLRIDGEHELHSGDTLKVGPLDFEVIATYADKPAKKPPVKDVADMAARTASSQPDHSVEDDISDWLGEPEQPTSGKWSVAETQAIQAATAETVKLPASETPPGITDPAATSGIHKGEPGKLPKIEPPKPKDSREAAANILKQLSKRR